MTRLLLENPLLRRSLRAIPRSPVALLLGLLAVGGSYGAAALVFKTASNTESAAEAIYTVCYWMNFVLLFPVGGVLCARLFAIDRESGALDQLRLSALGPLAMSVGYVAAGLLFPIVLVVAALPVFFVAALLVEVSIATFLFDQLILLLGACCLAPIAILLSHWEKPKHAGTAAFLIAVFGFSALAPLTDALPVLELALPFAGGLHVMKEDPFGVHVFALDLPGRPLQLLLFALCATLFFRSLTASVRGAGARALDRYTAGAMTAVVGVLLFGDLVSSAEAGPSRLQRPLEPAFICFFSVLLSLAWAFAPRRARLALFLWRRERDLGTLGPRPSTPLLGPLLCAGVFALFSSAVALLLRTLPALDADWVFAAGLAGALSLGAFALFVQATNLLAPERYGGVLVVFGVLFYCGATFAAGHWAGKFAGLPGLGDLLYAANPLYAVASLLGAVDSSPVVKARASSVVTGSLVSSLLLGVLFGYLVWLGRRRCSEFVSRLVSLPPDATRRPGVPVKTCPRGHTYEASWADCPYCAPSGSDERAD